MGADAWEQSRDNIDQRSRAPTGERGFALLTVLVIAALIALLATGILTLVRQLAGFERHHRRRDRTEGWPHPDSSGWMRGRDD
jgi:hypothetical protein